MSSGRRPPISGGRRARAHRSQVGRDRDRVGGRYRIEGYYEAVLIGGLDGLTLDPKEVLEARLFNPADLPDEMPEAHRELAASL